MGRISCIVVFSQVSIHMRRTISGEAETGDGQKISMDGRFFYFPKGETHGATKITKETIALFYWDGPPTPEIKDHLGNQV